MLSGYSPQKEILKIYMYTNYILPSFLCCKKKKSIKTFTLFSNTDTHSQWVCCKRCTLYLNSNKPQIETYPKIKDLNDQNAFHPGSNKLKINAGNFENACNFVPNGETRTD